MTVITHERQPQHQHEPRPPYKLKRQITKNILFLIAHTMKPTTPLPVIPLTRDNRVDSSHLDLINNALRGNTLAIKYLPNMLRYANSLLAASESRCRSPYDQPRAEVIYGNTTFLFSRWIQTTKDH